MMDDARWTQCTPSEYAWERSALAYLKSVIPDREPYRAWANAEFIGADGSVNEIDLLLIAPGGIVLVEVKSWSGVLTGDAGTWQQDLRALENPVIGANRKARKLRSLLAAQPSLRGRRLPRVDGIVFLSEPTLDVQLMPEGKANVYGPRGQGALPSISEYLIKPGLVDASLSRAIKRAIEQAGIRESEHAGIPESQRAPAALRLYVSAPSDLDLRPLLDGLKRRGAEPYVLSDVAPLGTEILHSLRLAIQRADRVLVVLGEAPAPNPMFEAGLALGLGKPLLIIAAPGATVPADLAGQVIVRARPDDLDAINFALDQVQERATRETRRTPGPGGHPLGAAVADQLLARLGMSGHTEASSIAILLEAIEASGSVAVVNTERDPGFDLGVWSDDLEAIGGNPLLVEVKRSLVPGAVDQVLHGLADHPNARLGLVVYLEPSAADRPTSRAELDQARFPVLIISLQQLLRRMASASFAEVVRDMRNRSAHGLSPS